jgi:predicted nucleic acid-binding protein
MLVLTDTGIIVRITDRADPLHGAIRQAARIIKRSGYQITTAPQNMAEFWNLNTRPATARGGFGLSIQETDWRARIVERTIRVLDDGPAVYKAWRKLVVQHSVRGVQVHDARLVAFMQVHSIKYLLTLNPSDFARYPGITAWTPQDVVAMQSIP